MSNNNLDVSLFEFHWWPDGDGRWGWSLDVLAIELPGNRGKYCLVTLIWRGGWEPKLLAFGLLAGQLTFSTHMDFHLGPIYYNREDGLSFDGWKNGLWSE